jgi:MFS family permease
VDWAGAVAATLTLAALTYVLTRLPDAASPLPEDLLTALMLLVAGAVGLVWIERRAAAPLVAPSLFRSREFSGLNAMTLLLYAALSGALFLLPYNLIQLQAYSAAEAGIAIAPLGVLIGLLSRYSGRISDRIGPRPLLVVGPVLVAAGCAGLALPGIGGSYLTTYFVPVMILALGMATAVSPLTTAVMNSVPGNRSGTASGINNAASRIAGLVAVAVSGALAAGVFDSALQARLTELNPGADVSRTMMAQTDKLAELSVPTNAGPEMRNALQQAVDEAFLAAFRAAVLLNAVLAGLAALIAALVLRPGRDLPGISQNP